MGSPARHASGLGASTRIGWSVEASKDEEQGRGGAAATESRADVAARGVGVNLFPPDDARVDSTSRIEGRRKMTEG